MHRTNDLKLTFYDDELNLMMLYNPGTHEGLIAELTKLQSQLTCKDQELRG